MNVLQDLLNQGAWNGFQDEMCDGIGLRRLCACFEVHWTEHRQGEMCAWELLAMATRLLQSDVSLLLRGALH